MPRKTKKQLATEAAERAVKEAEQAALQARTEALAEDRKTLQELDDTLARKISPALRVQVLRLRDEIAVRIQQRVDTEAREAQQQIAEREQASAATQATISTLTQEVEATKQRIASLESRNSDLKSELTDTSGLLRGERKIVDELRSQLGSAELRLSQIVNSVFEALKPFTDDGRALEKVAKRYFDQGHKIHDHVFQCFGISAACVDQWRQKEQAKKAEQDWQAIRSQNATLSAWPGRSPAPLKTAPAKRTDDAMALITGEKPSTPAQVDPIDEYIATLPPLPDVGPDVEVPSAEQHAAAVREVVKNFDAFMPETDPRLAQFMNEQEEKGRE